MTCPDTAVSHSNLFHLPPNWVTDRIMREDGLCPVAMGNNADGCDGCIQCCFPDIDITCLHCSHRWPFDTKDGVWLCIRCASFYCKSCSEKDSLICDKKSCGKILNTSSGSFALEKSVVKTLKRKIEEEEELVGQSYSNFRKRMRPGLVKSAPHASFQSIETAVNNLWKKGMLNRIEEDFQTVTITSSEDPMDSDSESTTDAPPATPPRDSDENQFALWTVETKRKKKAFKEAKGIRNDWKVLLFSSDSEEEEDEGVSSLDEIEEVFSFKDFLPSDAAAEEKEAESTGSKGEPIIIE